MRISDWSSDVLLFRSVPRIGDEKVDQRRRRARASHALRGAGVIRADEAVAAMGAGQFGLIAYHGAPRDIAAMTATDLLGDRYVRHRCTRSRDSVLAAFAAPSPHPAKRPPATLHHPR